MKAHQRLSANTFKWPEETGKILSAAFISEEEAKSMSIPSSGAITGSAQSLITRKEQQSEMFKHEENIPKSLLISAHPHPSRKIVIESQLEKLSKINTHFKKTIVEPHLYFCTNKV